MLTGKLVRLRPIDPKNDANLFVEWLNDYEITKFLGMARRMPLTKERERSELRRISSDEKTKAFAIETIAEGRLIGSMGLVHIDHLDGTALTGTLIGDKRYWRKGYATDAKMVLLRYAFTVLNLRRISTRIIADNKASVRVQEKCGYVREGVWKQEIYANGKYRDLVLLAVFRKGWMKRWQKYMRGYRS